ncbi:MAG: complex I subunit 1/NuoH family protein, partial [Acidobacteriaceae bacterium]
MTVALIVEYTIKSALILIAMTIGFAYGTFYERKALARMQSRIGPNRAGPWGIFQPVADGVKLIFKEEFIPKQADKLLFLLAPVITVIPALIITAVVPWGRSINLFGYEIHLYLANVNIAVLYLSAIASISVYGIVLAGWSSNNKYAMMGGLRSTAQMISYELALGLSLVSVTLLAGSLSLVDIVEIQGAHGFLGWIVWNLQQPLGFVLFMVAVFAETNR